MEVRWLETGSDSTDSPMLRAVFPVTIDNPKFYSQVPFDVAERPVDGKLNGKDAPSYQKHADAYGIYAESQDGQEVPAQKWVDVTDGKVGIALLNRTKYGHSYHNGDLRLTLMRTAGDPDIYPNLGKFNISYSLYPHSGDWKNGVWAEGDNFNVPVYAAEPPSRALVQSHASRPEEDSFFNVDVPGVIVSGIKKSEDGKELIVRLAEIDGSPATVTLTVPVNVAVARRLNILEFPLENAVNPVVAAKTIQLKIRANEIVTLGILSVK
jgi:alpha-mannosidase